MRWILFVVLTAAFFSQDLFAGQAELSADMEVVFSRSEFDEMKKASLHKIRTEQWLMILFEENKDKKTNIDLVLQDVKDTYCGTVEYRLKYPEYYEELNEVYEIALLDNTNRDCKDKRPGQWELIIYNKNNSPGQSLVLWAGGEPKAP